ncbi:MULTISPECIES: hypothetical protein [Bacillus cereus group]|nr:MULTISPECIES: hypothetical protein [Bacillus cereus group]MCD1179903.1 hypothetical protein [Bacillus paranthracis]MCR6462165.1 hypothetical protein [Bacillus paranthracis]MDA2594807.1 hypothetical protein [Bacillus cereus group sp. Bc061]
MYEFQQKIFLLLLQNLQNINLKQLLVEYSKREIVQVLSRNREIKLNKE